MRIALYGLTPGLEHSEPLRILFEQLDIWKAELVVYEPFYKHIKATFGLNPRVDSLFNSPCQIIGQCSLMLSIGGDGTFLESAAYVQDTEIPIAGINFGRLGFLAHITSKSIQESIEHLCSNQYTIEHRSVLQVNQPSPLLSNFPYALNDFTLQKKGTTMITIEAYINEEYLCTYWADGLILSTPTGSTAYSLSVGGPILSPGAKVFALSAIAPHHLTVRSLVIPDDSTITLIANGRDSNILASIDSRTFNLPASVKLSISKANFKINIVNLRDSTYYKTLRNKLMWGADQRNCN